MVYLKIENSIKLLKLTTLSFLIFILSATFSFSSEYNTIKPSEIWISLQDKDFKNIAQISTLVKNKKYSESLKLLKEFKLAYLNDGQQFNIYDSLENIVLWHKYSDNKSDSDILFSDISRFISDNGFYPNISDLKVNAEEIAKKQNIPYEVSEKYFSENIPVSSESKLYLLESKIKFLATINGGDDRYQRIKKEISAEISRIWIEEDFSDEKEEEFFNQYKNYLNESDHINRIDRLLWDGKLSQSKKILYLVNSDYQKLFTAIINIKNTPKYIDRIILSVPRYLRSNENLLYHKVLWYKSNDKEEDLIKAIISLPKNMQFPQKWWKLRHLYAREMIKAKEYKIAYYLAKDHGLVPSDKDFWEAEWMAGWISLRFVDKPIEAIARFKNLFNNVGYPVSLSRASYWVARSAESLNQKDEAIKWYKIAARYPLFFYGQLAIHKHKLLDPINSQNDTILPKEPKISKIDITKSANSQTLQIAYLLYEIGDIETSKQVFKSLVSHSKSESEIAVIMKLVNNLNDQSLDVEIARVASQKNVFFIRDKFQIIKDIADDEYSPLVHAIIKQESGFAQTAVSRVGAIGFMQIMPDTAKLVARDLGIIYSKQKLTQDASYNIKLGSFYIKQLIDTFDGSELLAIASYNAGPNATRRWIAEFYDPRDEKDIDKVVDWIELITYSETRNYVQRITENMIVYKYIMSRKNYDSVK
jgi:soluble lytic murein transglycosylase